MHQHVVPSPHNSVAHRHSVDTAHPPTGVVLAPVGPGRPGRPVTRTALCRARALTGVHPHELLYCSYNPSSMSLRGCV